MKNEKTHKPVASEASDLLRNPKTPAAIKSVAGSALTQAPDKKKKR
jgi:hypothetical protein